MTQSSLGSLDIAIRLSLMACAAVALLTATETLGARQTAVQAVRTR